MTPAHTPGPWKAEGWKGTVVNDADGRTLVLCPGSTADEASANARLIASAPALLAACEYILREANETSIDGYGYVRLPVIDAVQAAIRAARGE